MRDPYNPMRDDVRDWAFSDGALEPVQDWDLMLANLREFDLYAELAADDSCPNREYFLRVLYLIVGDAVRTNFRTESAESINEILEITVRFPNYCFHLLRQRALALLSAPSTFEYDDWCAGRLVDQDLSPTD